MRATIALSLLLLALVTTQACGASAPTQEVLQTAVLTALDPLVAEDNQNWRLEKLGYQTPIEARARYELRHAA